MPLYALDKNGRVYQTEGIGDADLGVGYYADDVLGEERSVYFGETSNRAERRMAQARQKKLIAQRKRQQAINAHKAKVAAVARQQAAQNQAQAKAVRQKEARIRAMKRKQYLEAIEDSQDPMNQIESQFMGNPMQGFEHEGEALMNSEAITNADLSGDYDEAEPFGNTMYGEYEDEGMGGLGKSLRKAVKKVSKAAGKIVAKTNPITLTAKIAKQIPIVKDVYKGVNKISGGLLTSVENISRLPEKAISGKKITKAEFMEAAMMALKVGAIAATGGSAMTVISAGAGQLKGGPLGKTSFGRAILSVAEVGSISAVGGQSISKVLEKKAQDMAAAHAASAVGKKAGVIGSIAAGAAVSAGFAGVGGGSTGTVKADATVANTVAKNSDVAAKKAAETLTEQVKKGAIKFDSQAAMQSAQKEVMAKAKQEVSKEFEKKTGIPLDIATRVAKGDIPRPEEIASRAKEKINQGIDEAQAELARTVAQIPTSEPAMRRVLEIKQQALDAEIKKRIVTVEKVKEDAAKELVAVNEKLVTKLQAANAQNDLVAKMSADLKTLTEQFERAGSTNAAVKNDLWPKIQALTAKLAAERTKLDKMADDAWTTSDIAKAVEDKGAVRVIQAELTPNAKGVRNEFSHPLVGIG